MKRNVIRPNVCGAVFSGMKLRSHTKTYAVPGSEMSSGVYDLRGKDGSVAKERDREPEDNYGKLVTGQASCFRLRVSGRLEGQNTCR